VSEAEIDPVTTMTGARIFALPLFIALAEVQVHLVRRPHRQAELLFKQVNATPELLDLMYRGHR